ncbi:serine/threonine protein kinase [Calothrix sp. PCC 6303]|uniref:serine/threonine protein kinase n=1 Tax=Calothrix sp. PCC 6303 TaxID=1170562 RepID=UPI0002A03BA9|nr:serine/threonine-protein kinase [Calothrix sp. PCC 6303]AFZ02265.1 serine/threonine protein kinase [Calothrix sp. PCC 6303]
MLQAPVNNLVMAKIDLDDYIGKFLNNRYLIRELIGRGGMGRVYLAEDTAKGGLPVALKILSLSLANQQMSQRFAREIFIGAQLGRKSKHIIKVLSYGLTDDKIPFYVMEYLQGTNLKKLIKSSPLDLSEFIKIITQICLGLQCAHQGINLKGEIYPVLHRDIKPENIFIAEDSKVGKVVKILDFGIAKFLTERAGMTLTEAFIGSLPYCSPEHMEGRKLVDVRSDIYSLGVIMYEMLTGIHPFELTSNSFGNWYQAHRFQTPPDFSEIVPQLEIPDSLQRLVLSCLAKDVKNRPHNLRVILDKLEDIQKYLNGEVTHVANNNFTSKSSALQLVPVTEVTEKICLQKTWPRNKPVSPICFPHLLQTNQGSIPTLWAMLPKAEISKLSKQINCTEFIYQPSLYPVILWVTALCDGDFGLTRWLSYFLDLQDSKSQKVAQSLASNGYYHLLFFALEDPTKCQDVMTIMLSAYQRQALMDWLEQSEKTKSLIAIDDSKAILKSHYEKIKPEIIGAIAENNKALKTGMKQWFKKILSRTFNALSRPVF